MLYFARAQPSEIKITETYRYQTNISGNPTLDEANEPEGEIRLCVPWDGYQFFTRQAYRDYIKQIRHPHSGQSAGSSQPSDQDRIRIGYLALSGLSPKEFWPGLAEPLPRQVLSLDFKPPEPPTQLLEDRQAVILRHTYRPKRPNVDPRPHPVWLQVDVFDERVIQDMFGDRLYEFGDQLFEDEDRWKEFTQELSFERSLVFAFKVELALPCKDKEKDPCDDRLPKKLTLKRIKLKWPASTSHHNLHLKLEPGIDDKEAAGTAKRGERDWRKWPEQSVFYDPEKGQVEWRDIPFRSGPYPEHVPSPNQIVSYNPQLWHTPLLLLFLNDPGEFYETHALDFELEIELEGLLLSGGELDLFHATGEIVRLEKINHKIKLSTRLQVKGEINLRQRFDRRTLSPHQQLQFEGVILESIRIMDISVLLKDKGFVVRKDWVPSDPLRPAYVLWATRTEGPDELNIWILAHGKTARTKRESTIPGGRKFTSSMERGNMVLDIRCEMRGDVGKLTQLMNEVHRDLKERFSHISTLE